MYTKHDNTPIHGDVTDGSWGRGGSLLYRVASELSPEGQGRAIMDLKEPYRGWAVMSRGEGDRR